MPIDVVVVGAGGFGRETLDVIEAFNETVETDSAFNVLGIVDDAPSAVNLDRLTVRGYAYLGTLDHVLAEYKPMGYFLGIGSPQVKMQLASKMESAGWQPQTVVHPSATVGSLSEIGEGSIVCGGVQLSTNTFLGRHVHLNPNSTIGHDSRLGDFVSVNPAATVSGAVEIGDRALIGANAVVLQQLTIGRDALVGAAACVTRSVVDGVTVTGTPARPLERSNTLPIAELQASNFGVGR